MFELCIESMCILISVSLLFANIYKQRKIVLTQIYTKNTRKIRVEIGGRAAAYLFAYFMRTDLKKILSPQIRQIRIKRVEIRTILWNAS